MRERLDQLCCALMWLTQLPVPPLRRPDRPLAEAAWAFPLAGLAVGAIGAAALAAAQAAGVPALAAGALAVGAMALATGGFHEDGLSDCADAAGGWTQARRLEIMRDSRIGAHGALALLIVTLVRAACLGALGPGALIAAAMASRALPVAVMAALPPARDDGAGRAAGRPTRATVAAALVLGAGPLLWHAGIATGAAALALAALGAALAARWARLRLGGLTGDLLGAVQQLAESAVLITLASAASRNFA